MECPKCGEKEYIFGTGKTKAVADKFNIPVLAEIPLDTNTRVLVDNGQIEDVDVSAFDDTIKIIKELKK